MEGNSEWTGHLVDPASLPPRYPTHAHPAEFWESLGRAVASFGFLEEQLKRAYYALTGTVPAPLGEAEQAASLQAWNANLERVIVMTLRPLIDQFATAAKNNPRVKIGNLDDFLVALRDAVKTRNILCHASWQPPDESGASRAFYVTGKPDQLVVFDTLVTVAWFDQVQAHVCDLAREVFNSVTHTGYQFPGSNGPGRPLSRS